MDFNFNIDAPPGPAEVSLAALAEGTTGLVLRVALGDSHDLERLEVMGLCPGRTVEVVKRGDPMIVRVLGTRIGLAAVLAERVTVQPHEEGALR